MTRTCSCNQYGIPTPKALPAFTAAEAEEVAKSFGRVPARIPVIARTDMRVQLIPMSSSSRLKF